MSVIVTYEPEPLNRVKIEADGLTVGTTAVRVERSTNQATWTLVRCGEEAPVVSGVATIYDYEFEAGVTNYYRIIYPGLASFVAAGAASHGNNASVTPGLPAGLQAGDLLLLLAAIRNHDGGTANAPAGYTLIGDISIGPTTLWSNVRLFAKIATGAEVGPTVSFFAGVANASTSAQLAAFRGISLLPAGMASQLNGSQQNIPTPALTLGAEVDLGFRLFMGWKQDDWTSVTSGATEIGEPSTTLGDDQGITWAYDLILGPTSSVPIGGFSVTGGAAAISKGAVAVWQTDRVTQTGSITPTLDSVWIKVISSPFLNRSYECVFDESPVVRQARTGIFEVLGRSFPVATTDVRASREQTIRVTTKLTQEYEDLDFLLSLGEPVFIHTPQGYPIKTQYAVIGQTSMTRPVRNRRIGTGCDADWRVFTLPLREVAAPGPDVCGSTITWQGVLNTYATWQDVLDNEASWFDLLQNVGDPGDVVVP